MSGIMDGKVVVMTGATSGIGQVAAEQFAAWGARIVQVARDRIRGASAMARLEQIAPELEHTIHYADLSVLSQVRNAAHAICATEPRVDVLINNAGAIFSSRALTAEGLERTFALNHMAYFGLTLILLDRLRASAPARIINTASDAHTAATLDFDDLQSAAAYARRDWGEILRYGGPAYEVYARSKLCNVLFTRALSQRLEGTGVTANSLHPGFVATRFADGAGGLIAFSTRIAKRFARSANKGAETLIFLTTAPQVAGMSGLYYHDCVPTSPSPAALDGITAERLWQESTLLWNRD